MSAPVRRLVTLVTALVALVMCASGLASAGTPPYQTWSSAGSTTVKSYQGTPVELDINVLSTLRIDVDFTRSGKKPCRTTPGFTISALNGGEIVHGANRFTYQIVGHAGVEDPRVVFDVTPGTYRIVPFWTCDSIYLLTAYAYVR